MRDICTLYYCTITQAIDNVRKNFIRFGIIGGSDGARMRRSCDVRDTTWLCHIEFRIFEIFKIQITNKPKMPTRRGYRDTVADSGRLASILSDNRFFQVYSKNEECATSGIGPGDDKGFHRQGQGNARMSHERQRPLAEEYATALPHCSPRLQRIPERK
jgi:hypothetical protein